MTLVKATRLEGGGVINSKDNNVSFVSGTMSVGFDHLDLEALKEKGIKVDKFILKYT